MPWRLRGALPWHSETTCSSVFSRPRFFLQPPHSCRTAGRRPSVVASVARPPLSLSLRQSRPKTSLPSPLAAAGVAPRLLPKRRLLPRPPAGGAASGLQRRMLAARQPRRLLCVASGGVPPPPPSPRRSPPPLGAPCVAGLAPPMRQRRSTKCPRGGAGQQRRSRRPLAARALADEHMLWVAAPVPELSTACRCLLSKR